MKTIKIITIIITVVVAIILLLIVMDKIFMGILV
jgi:hypothetical protein